MSVRCTSENKEACSSFEIQYCCPSEFDNDENIEKAERPFPVFNKEKQGSCSQGAPHYENGSFIDIEGTIFLNESLKPKLCLYFRRK